MKLTTCIVSLIINQHFCTTTFIKTRMPCSARAVKIRDDHTNSGKNNILTLNFKSNWWTNPFNN